MDDPYYQEMCENEAPTGARIMKIQKTNSCPMQGSNPKGSII